MAVFLNVFASMWFVSLWSKMSICVCKDVCAASSFRSCTRIFIKFAIAARAMAVCPARISRSASPSPCSICSLSVSIFS